MTENISQDDVLKYAVEKGIIDLSNVQKKIEMARRKEIIENHKYRIWYSETDGYWRTYIQDITNLKGYRLVKKKHQKDLYDAIVDNYNAYKKLNIVTFKKCFSLSLESRKNIISPNTYYRYQKDYERFFKGTDFEIIEMKDIKYYKVKEFIITQIQKLNLRVKAMKSLHSHIINTFLFAMRENLIQENPCAYIEKPKYFERYCYKPIVNVEDRIVTDSQMAKINDAFRMKHLEDPCYIPVYAVELASLTGMRVGELAALRWDSIHDGIIFISKMEIYDQIKKTYSVVDFPKNRVPRVFPITTRIQNLLDLILKVETMQGNQGEYVFMDDDGRVHKNRITDCARNISMRANIDNKSIHSYRRTVNSTLKFVGADTATASSMIGNTTMVNENYYTYDISDIAYKRELLEKVNKKTVSC